MARRLASRAARTVFAVAGLAFLVIAFARSWDGSVTELTVTWWLLVVAGGLALAGLWCAAAAWISLIGGERRRSLAAGFYLSQLGKYIPGGIWQAIGQIGYTVRVDVAVPRATTAFAVFAVTQSAAGGAVGALLAVARPDAPALVRLAALAAAGLVLLLHRRWMLVAVRLIRRFQGHDDSDELVPGQRAIARAFMWSVVTMTAQGAAFAIILADIAPGAPVLAMVSAAALAWTIGFLALPVPSGIGVREAVVIAGLAPLVGPSAAIVASVYQRLLTIAGEVVMIVLYRWTPIGREATAPAGGAAPHSADP